MRILLTDGAGLTSRQVATQLHRAGHTVHTLAPPGPHLTRFTRHVHRVHRVPPYGHDPFAWLDVAEAVIAAEAIDVVLPTQEQVAVLAFERDRIAALGVALAVPTFTALAAVQDKASAQATLRRIGVAQPDTALVTDEDELRDVHRFPAFLKAPIGTASNGVQHVASLADLEPAIVAMVEARSFELGGVVVQAPAVGPLLMVQAVFDEGRLVAWHANERVAEGANGGACAKRSVVEPALLPMLETLGTALGWHGALSLDAIATVDGPLVIDVNPRLVEPGNASRDGVDLVDALLAVSLGRHPDLTGPGTDGVRTHQLLLALLGDAQRGAPRRLIARTLLDGIAHRGDLADSHEELLPPSGDPLTLVPLALVATVLLAWPRSWREFASGSVDAYALSPAGWQAILARAAERSLARTEGAAS